MVNALIVSAIFIFFEVVVYAGLIAVMPRSGGDYVWQSRILGGAVGFILAVTGWWFILWLWASIRRKLLSAANDIAKLAYRQESSFDTVMDEAEKVVFGVSERRMTRDLQSIQDVLSEYYDRIDQISRRGEEFTGVPTGFIDLDRILSGLQGSDLIIIAGRPGMGKTAFMLNIAKHAALVHKKHVAVFSLEMSNEQLVQRLISQETGIDSQRLRTGKLNDDEWPIFTQAIETLMIAESESLALFSPRSGKSRLAAS